MSFKEFIKENEETKGFVTNIEKDTTENNNFRKVLFTTENMQLVLMSLKPNEDIGEETHDNVDQFFRIDEGSGKVIINKKEQEITDGSAFIIPRATLHNVIAGENGLKLYSIYTPPNHKDGTIHETKEEAIKDEKDIPKKE
jgi:mannose-6-phosphate isomerase-like protein (cupin superfamily)